jgi:hypothetical protein
MAELARGDPTRRGRLATCVRAARGAAQVAGPSLSASACSRKPRCEGVMIGAKDSTERGASPRAGGTHASDQLIICFDGRDACRQKRRALRS